ncbi:MAG TPA: DUF898 family protein [Candidatus Binatia bacterium]|nr:DUF898 family protein [Candidatus Binatia bacterium]
MTVEAVDTQPFSHTGKFFNVLGLALKNAFLTVVTLTLYRFWARTSMRRRLWSRAWVMGDPLEYTGSAWELVRGFLIALPTFFLPWVFVAYIAPLVMNPVTAAWLGFGFWVIFVPLVAAARYWMRRYQLSRTRWRGIRMGLAGSAWGFAFASWGWWVLQVLSLGWYTPAARMNKARLMWENTRFGDQPFEFVNDDDSPQKGLWGPFALGWIGTVIIVFGVPIGVGFLSTYLMTIAGIEFDPENPMTYGMYSAASVVAMIVVGLFLWLVVWAPYNAAALNRIASLISIDGARFRLKAKTISLFFVTLAGWLVTILSLTLLAPAGGFLQIRYVMNRLEIIGSPKFAEIGQPVIEGPRAGESLGDAFDLDMGVGVI